MPLGEQRHRLRKPPDSRRNVGLEVERIHAHECAAQHEQRHDRSHGYARRRETSKPPIDENNAVHRAHTRTGSVRFVGQRHHSCYDRRHCEHYASLHFDRRAAGFVDLGASDNPHIRRNDRTDHNHVHEHIVGRQVPTA